MRNKTKLKGTKLSEQEYKKMKLSLEAGWKVSPLAKMANRSYQTINDINKTADYEAYKEYRKEQNEKIKLIKLRKRGVISKPDDAIEPIVEQSERKNQVVKELRQIKKVLISIDTTLKSCKSKGIIRFR